MKNLKLLSVLGIAVFSLLSFTYFNDENQIKDGTYKAYVSKSTSKDVNGFSGGNSYAQKVNVIIADNTIKNISQISHNKNHDKLLDLQLRIDFEGNAVTETSFFEQNVFNKRDPGYVYTYKLTIKKEELTK